MYDLPLGSQKVIDGDCSGVYYFVHKKTGKYGIRSAISFRNRLNDHMNSFYGNRLRSRLHDWVMANGDVSSIKWAPIITYDNIVQQWYSIHYAFPLSQGGVKILQGFGQYVSRILEQCVYTNYKPYFNIKDEQKLKDTIFFNFSFEASELSLSLDQTHVYQALLNKDATILLAESNSYNSLADQLKISVGTVRNNMNWYTPFIIFFAQVKKGNIFNYLKKSIYFDYLWLFSHIYKYYFGNAQFAWCFYKGINI